MNKKNAVSLKNIEDMIGKVLSREDFLSKVRADLIRNTAAHSSQIDLVDFAQDMVSETCVKLIETIRKSGNCSVFTLDDLENDLLKYMLISVRNNSISYFRSSQWKITCSSVDFDSTCSKNGEIDSLLEDAAVSQLFPMDQHDDASWVSQRLKHLGVQPDVIDLIWLRCAGYTFNEIAAMKGGTPDKYRKLTKRTVGKLALYCDVEAA